MQTFMKVEGLVYTVNEPELSFTPNKKPVVKFCVASNRRWKDDGGTEHEESCFVECTCWGKLAESVDKYVGKGDPLYIEGNLKQEIWESKDLAKQSRHTITANRVVFLKPKD